jgi:hypothetical protein
VFLDEIGEIICGKDLGQEVAEAGANRLKG